MCRVEERVYVGADGRRQTFEESFLCSNAHRGKFCADVKRKTTEYHSRPNQIAPARDNSASPSSYNPPTPTGTGSYLVQQIQPSSAGRRPSTRDGNRKIKPEIIIQIGSKKDNGKKYTGSSTKSYKRSSLGAASMVSNDVAVESPGSDASYTLRTGFPEAPIPPTQHTSYTMRPAAVPRGHHRHTSSASSFTTSSQPPSLYATSDNDSPSSRRVPRYPPTIVHNPPSAPVSSFSTPSAAGTAPPPGPSSPYRTTIAVPRHSGENVGADGHSPVDYSGLFENRTGSPYASSARAAAPEITDRDAERARQRKARADADKKSQEEADHKMAKAIAKDEEVKQVRFEIGRAEARSKERAENQFAQYEMRRAEEREEARRQKQQEQKDLAALKAREEADRAAMEARKEADRAAMETRKEADRLREDIAQKEREIREAESTQKTYGSRPRDSTKRHRRSSVSQHDLIERDRLLAETRAQMAIEREAAERREREEQAALLLEQQQQPQYWDPRGGSRIPVTNDNTGMGRRNSVSGRRGSVSSVVLPPPMGIDRRNSQRRVSVIQRAPPANLTPVNTNFPSTLLSPSSAQPASQRPPSARHASYDKDIPVIYPSARVSNTSQDNPFATAASPLDSWDARDLRDALPRESAPTHSRQHSDDRRHHTLRRRGEEVIERAAAGGTHDRARQATRNMGKVVGFEDDYIDNDGESEERPRSSRTKGGKRRA